MPKKTPVLIITRNLPPLIGGMERLIWHIVDELHNNYSVHVIGPSGCSRYLPSEVTVSEVPIKPIFNFFLRTKLATLYQSLRLRPELVFAGSGLTAPFAWFAARLTGARCIIYLHGLDIEIQHPVYRFLWRPFFRHADRILVNSKFTRELAIDAGINPSCINILHPGVEIPRIDKAQQQSAYFRKKHNLIDVPIILYVGRIAARKGLATFIRDIFPAVISAYPDAILVVIGDEPNQALHRQTGERQQVNEAIAANKLKENLLFLSNVDDDMLQAAYFAADVFIFPVQERTCDHEGFGMVALEAAAHGLPTVAFAVGGVTDAVSDGFSGNLIAAGDNHGFAQSVINQLDNSPDTTATWAENAHNFATGFQWANFGKYLRQYVKFL